jgi:subtilisin family serine protease
MAEKTRHIVLRVARPATRDPFLGPMAAAAGVEAAPAPADVKVDIEEATANQIPALSRQPDVVAVAPAMPMRLVAPVATAADTAPLPAPAPAATNTWGIAAVGADTSPCDGSGVIVAVLDTGIDKTHPAFAGITILEQDFTGAGNGDTNGHGTHCAGTIFGRDVTGTRIGVARGVTRALIGKVIGPTGGSSDHIVSAMQWALDNGANVISMSLGIDFPGYQAQLEASGKPKQVATSMALEGYRANVQLFERLASLIRARAAFSLPCIVIAAAGNESERDTDPTFVIAVAPPAVADGIISVAAVGQGTGGFTVAPFSNTGANVAGPGVGIVSAKAGGGLRTLSGTSMATPHVAGVAALWAQRVMQTGPLTSLPWSARLIASGNMTGFAAGFEPFDFGAGLVHAPQ